MISNTKQTMWHGFHTKDTDLCTAHEHDVSRLDHTFSLWWTALNSPPTQPGMDFTSRTQTYAQLMNTTRFMS